VFYDENAIRLGMFRLVRQQARSAGGDERLHDPEPRLRGLSDQHPGLQLPPDDGSTGKKTDTCFAIGCTYRVLYGSGRYPTVQLFIW
jgi:hypothetical protein